MPHIKPIRFLSPFLIFILINYTQAVGAGNRTANTPARTQSALTRVDYQTKTIYIQVGLEEYQELMNKHSNGVPIQLAQVNPKSEADSEIELETKAEVEIENETDVKPDSICLGLDSLHQKLCIDSLKETKSSSVETHHDITHPQDEVTSNFVSQFFAGFISESSSDEDDDAKKKSNKKDEKSDGSWTMIFFVVIGVMVVAAFAVMMVKMIYDLFYKQVKASPFFEFGFRYGYSIDHIRDNEGNPVLEANHYPSLFGSIGFDRGKWGMGFEGRLGHYFISLEDKLTGESVLEMNHSYMALGPLIFFHLGSYRTTLSFLGGTSLNSHPTYIFASNLRMDVVKLENFFAGFNLGTIYTDLDPTDGLLLKDGKWNRDLNYSAGFQMGWSW